MDDSARVERAIEIADELLRAAEATITRAERRRQARLGRLVADPAGRDLVQRLTDEVLRLDRPRTAARRFAALAGAGIPRSLGRADRLLMAAGARVGRVAPALVMPLVRRRIIAETRGLVIPADDASLTRHISAAHERPGMQLNLNLLGEAILSDAEAEQRIGRVIATLQRPDVDYISVKISAICALLDVYAFEHSVERISAALRRDLRRGDRRRHRRRSSTSTWRSTATSSSPSSRSSACSTSRRTAALPAGIVLQAYLPDSHDAMERIGAWAAARVADGGAPIKVRIVKGANLAMEQVDAEQHGWVQAPYPTKADTDASYKRLLDSCLRPEWAGAVRLGVASHNLFDVAWALTLRDELAGVAARRHRHRDARGHGAGADPGRPASAPARCCCTARSSATTRSRRASPTSPAASTRTPRRRTSCGRCSRCARVGRVRRPGRALPAPPSPTVTP